MTGFGSSETNGFRIEVRSLNHRFMDISIKCPPVLSKHEMALRDILRSRFMRGKFDVYISFIGEFGVRAILNKKMANEVFAMLTELKETLNIKERISLEALLNWRDLFIDEEAHYDPKALFETFNEAVVELEKMRLKEGKALTVDISSRIDTIEELNNEIASKSPAILESMKKKFLERLDTVFEGFDCEEHKLLQEAAALAEKCDITEEVVRLRGHNEHIRNILLEGGVVGRKMDFLVQELNREANTIASKASDPVVSESVVSMKAEIERVREQVQNVQ